MRARPTQMELFDVLYDLAARNGREEALFGYDVLLARLAFERMLIGSDFPRLYLEFPLFGAPGFDVLAGYDNIEPGVLCQGCWVRPAGHVRLACRDLRCRKARERRL